MVVPNENRDAAAVASGEHVNVWTFTDTSRMESREIEPLLTASTRSPRMSPAMRNGLRIGLPTPLLARVRNPSKYG
jgi:hypothetical protein